MYGNLSSTTCLLSRWTRRPYLYKISKSKIDKEIKIINAVHRFKSVRLDMSFSVIKMKGGVGIWRTN